MESLGIGFLRYLFLGSIRLFESLSRRSAYVKFIARNIAILCSRSGSLTTSHLLFITMVARSVELNVGQRGILGLLGFPVRANAIQVSLSLSARAIASGPPPVSLAEIFTLSKANGISMVCGDLRRPPCTGLSHLK